MKALFIFVVGAAVGSGLTLQLTKPHDTAQAPTPLATFEAAAGEFATHLPEGMTAVTGKYLLGMLPPTERVWQDVHGRELTATYVESDASTVTIKRNDGQTFRISLEVLSSRDRHYVEGRRVQ